MNLVRQLHLKSEGTVRVVPVTFAAPVESRGSWFCRYEVGWPKGVSADEIGGADAPQALYLAMQAVALVLYASLEHKSGMLYWQKPGDGYGFPMPKAGYKDLVGEDRAAQV